LVSRRASAHYEGKSDHILSAHQRILELITSKERKNKKNQKTKTGVKSTQKNTFFLFFLYTLRIREI
jgi:hypothetical protein